MICTDEVILTCSPVFTADGCLPVTVVTGKLIYTYLQKLNYLKHRVFQPLPKLFIFLFTFYLSV